MALIGPIVIKVHIEIRPMRNVTPSKYVDGGGMEMGSTKRCV